MKLNIDFNYSKENAKIVSGIALLMMLVHHFWGFPYWLEEGNVCTPILSLNGLSLEEILANGCQLCIPIYAFNTGYVLFKRKESFTFSKNLKRVIRFLLSYWIVCFIFLLIGYYTGHNLSNFENLILNAIGINCGQPGHMSVPFAWYVSFYITFITLSPIILFLTKERNYKKDILFTIAWLSLLFLSVISPNIIKNTILTNTLINLFSVGLTSICAYMVAKYNIFSKLGCIIKQNIIISLMLIFTIIIARYFVSIVLLNYTGHSLGYFQDCIYTPIFVYCILNILKLTKSKIRTQKLLYSIGENSMNMWFLHGIFFIGISRLQWILYLPQYSIIVLLWGFILIYPASILITRFQSVVLRRLKL